jgi:arylsulfatase A-like enzyme
VDLSKSAATPLSDPTGAAFKQQRRQDRDNQFRMLKSVDDMVGNIYAALEAHHEADNTLAVYISDNGYLWGQFWLTAKPHSYLADVRTPMFLRWPAGETTGQVQRGTDSRLVANIDIAPTVLAAAGIPVNNQPMGLPMDGQNLLSNAMPGSNRSRLLLERPGRNCNPCSSSDSPTWASFVSAPGQPNSYQYTESYAGSHNSWWWDQKEYPPTITWQEYYNLAPTQDPFELTNRYGSDGDPSNDPSTTPSAAQLSHDLALARFCGGYSAPCP